MQIHPTPAATAARRRPARARLLAAALAGGALLGTASLASPALGAVARPDLPIQVCPAPQGCEPVDPTPDPVDPQGPGDLTDRPDDCNPVLIDCDGGDLTDRPRPTTPPTQPPAGEQPGNQAADVVVANPSFTG